MHLQRLISKLLPCPVRNMTPYIMKEFLFSKREHVFYELAVTGLTHSIHMSLPLLSPPSHWGQLLRPRLPSVSLWSSLACHLTPSLLYSHVSSHPLSCMHTLSCSLSQPRNTSLWHSFPPPATWALAPVQYAWYGNIPKPILYRNYKSLPLCTLVCIMLWASPCRISPPSSQSFLNTYPFSLESLCFNCLHYNKMGLEGLTQQLWWKIKILKDIFKIFLFLHAP